MADTTPAADTTAADVWTPWLALPPPPAGVTLGTPKVIADVTGDLLYYAVDAATETLWTLRQPLGGADFSPVVGDDGAADDATDDDAPENPGGWEKIRTGVIDALAMQAAGGAGLVWGIVEPNKGNQQFRVYAGDFKSHIGRSFTLFPLTPGSLRTVPGGAGPSFSVIGKMTEGQEDDNFFVHLPNGGTAYIALEAGSSIAAAADIDGNIAIVGVAGKTPAHMTSMWSHAPTDPDTLTLWKPEITKGAMFPGPNSGVFINAVGNMSMMVDANGFMNCLWTEKGVFKLYLSYLPGNPFVAPIPNYLPNEYLDDHWWGARAVDATTHQPIATALSFKSPPVTAFDATVDAFGRVVIAMLHKDGSGSLLAHGADAIFATPTAITLPDSRKVAQARMGTHPSGAAACVVVDDKGGFWSTTLRTAAAATDASSSNGIVQARAAAVQALTEIEKMFPDTDDAPAAAAVHAPAAAAAGGTAGALASPQDIDKAARALLGIAKAVEKDVGSVVSGLENLANEAGTELEALFKQVGSDALTGVGSLFHDLGADVAAAETAVKGLLAKTGDEFKSLAGEIGTLIDHAATRMASDAKVDAKGPLATLLGEAATLAGAVERLHAHGSRGAVPFPVDVKLIAARAAAVEAAITAGIGGPALAAIETEIAKVLAEPAQAFAPIVKAADAVAPPPSASAAAPAAPSTAQDLAIGKAAAEMLARTLGLIVDGVPLSVALTFGGEGGGDAEGEATAQADASVGAAVGGGVTVPVFGAGAAARAAVTNTTEAGIKAIEVSLTAVLLSPIVALLEIAAIWLEVVAGLQDA